MHYDVNEFAHHDERLSAYLDGQLSVGEVAALEAALAADPVLAAELDTVADVLVALRELDEAVPPPGFADRLRQRLASEVDTVEERTVDHEAPTVRAEVVQLSPRRAAWPVVSSAAAAVVLVVLLTNNMVLRNRSFTAATLGQNARGTPIAGTERLPSAAQLEVPEPLSEAARDRAAIQVVDSEAVLPDESAVRRHFSARGTAGAGSTLEAAPLRSGAVPGACLKTVASHASAPGRSDAAVERVESVVYAGRPALAYLVGTPTGWAVHVVDPATCETTEITPL